MKDQSQPSPKINRFAGTAYTTKPAPYDPATDLALGGANPTGQSSYPDMTAQSFTPGAAGSGSIAGAGGSTAGLGAPSSFTDSQQLGTMGNGLNALSFAPGANGAGGAASPGGSTAGMGAPSSYSDSQQGGANALNPSSTQGSYPGMTALSFTPGANGSGSIAGAGGSTVGLGDPSSYTNSQQLGNSLGAGAPTLPPAGPAAPPGGGTPFYSAPGAAAPTLANGAPDYSHWADGLAHTSGAPAAPNPSAAAPAGSLSNQWGSILGKLDIGNVPGLVGGDALQGQGTSARDAAYRQAAGYLDPQWANSQKALETQLVNQGVMQNSEAWNKAMDDFGRQKEFAYGQARDQAMQQGLAAQSQLFNQGLASNQNAFSQDLSGAQFTNSAQAQMAGQGLTAAQIAEQLQAAQAQAGATTNAAGIAANASMANIQAQLAQQKEQNEFNNSLSARNQGINELLLQQRNPLDIANMLNQGANTTQPNFTQVPGSSVAPTDIASIINQAFQGQQGNYNVQAGNANSSNSAMAAIIASIICDRRFKTNVRKIGMHVKGFPLYAFDYVWGEPGVGPMADEVRKVLPEAVIDMGGFDAVNMALLEAA